MATAKAYGKTDPYVVRRLRQIGWTQTQLAREAGVSRLTIRSWSLNICDLGSKRTYAGWLRLTALDEASLLPPPLRHHRPAHVEAARREAWLNGAIRIYVRDEDWPEWRKARERARALGIPLSVYVLDALKAYMLIDKVPA